MSISQLSNKIEDLREEIRDLEAIRNDIPADDPENQSVIESINKAIAHCESAINKLLKTPSELSNEELV